MKMAGFYDESISNGLGWRAVLFVSGCPHHCPGCHNKQAQDYNYGEEFNKQEILNRIQKNSILKGITVSGGEPLCKENIAEVVDFIKDVKKIKPNFNIWCYTGYTMEELEKKKQQIEDAPVTMLQNEFTKDITVVSNTKGAIALLKRIIYRLGISRRKEML